MRDSLPPRVVTLLVAACVGGCVADDGHPAGALRDRLTARIASGGADVVGLYYRNLVTSDSVLVDADVRVHAASTMKVPVMIQLYRDAAAGRIDMEDSVPVEQVFTSIVDGSRFTLDPASDSDSTLYAIVGQQVPIRLLTDRMITWSSNLATNILIELVDPRRVTETMRRFHADSIDVRRGVEDLQAFRAGLSNTVTARDLGTIFTALARGRLADSVATREMIAILERQQFNEGIPAGLPPGTRVAHKTGSITAINHDAGVVYLDGGSSYVLAVLVRGIGDHDESSRLISDLSRIVYDWVTRQG